MVSVSSLSKQLDVAHKPIYDITPFSTLDYPEHLSAIIWFAGCNMRCSYCYNVDIVFSKGKKTLEEVLEFLKKRIGMLEGVVLSGGEATQFKELREFCFKIKTLGFKIKLDTNGTNPKILNELLNKKLLDYVALDYKSPKSKFYEITKNKNFDDFEKSLKLLVNSKIGFEVRTTLHNDLLSEDDINEIIDELREIGYKGVYYIQSFIKDVDTIGGLKSSDKSFDKSRLSDTVKIEYR